MPELLPMPDLRGDIEQHDAIEELKDVLLAFYLGDPDCIAPVLGEVEELLSLLAVSMTHAVI